MKVTLNNYRRDYYYPRVVAAVSRILARGDVVAPIDVFVELGVLRRENLEAWRRGRISCLERVIGFNLSKASRVLRILRFHAHDLDMPPSLTVYKRWGKGPRQLLRFSRSGVPALEEAYSRHFLWKKTPDQKPKVFERYAPIREITEHLMEQGQYITGSETHGQEEAKPSRAPEAQIKAGSQAQAQSQDAPTGTRKTTG